MSIALSQGFLLHYASVIEAAATIATAASINFFFIMNYRSRRVPALALDWFKKTKSARPYLLPVPLVEAFALPIFVERANLQKPHAEYVYRSAVCAPAQYCRLNIHNPQASTVCCIPDEEVKVAKFQQAKKERRVNASKNVSTRPSAHIGLPQAICTDKYIKIFYTKQQCTKISHSVLIKTDMYRIKPGRAVLWYSVAYTGCVRRQSVYITVTGVLQNSALTFRG